MRSSNTMPWRAKLWAVEATLTMRDGADDRSRSSSRSVRRKGPRWLMAKVDS